MIRTSNNLSLRKLLFIVVAFVFLLSLAFAQLTQAQTFNQEINYQGKLADNLGSTVADGSYSMVFRLYTVDTGGTNIWSETQSVTVTNGLFSVMLGTSTSLSSVNFNQTLYLGVNVAADGEMTPRKILGAVPAAFEANNAQTVGGVASSSFLRSDIADTATNLLTFTGGFISSASSTISELTTGTTTVTTFMIDGEEFTSFSGGTSGLTNNAGTLTANISESNLNITGSPTNDYVLQASSTAVGGFAWVPTTSLGFDPSGTDNSTAVTLAGQNYLTINGSQQITAGAVDLSGTNVTGALAAARFPALTGDITTSAGSLSTAIAAGVINFGDINYTNTLVGNPALATGQSYFGSTGLLFEGSTADNFEGLLTTSNITGSDKTWTLPNTTGTIALTSSAMSGTFDGNNFAGGAIGTGDLLYGSAAGTIAERAIGTAGQVLQVNGGLPTWVATSSLGIGSNSLFTDSGVSTYLTSQTDNFGIGTTTPNSKLTVQGDINISDPTAGINFMGNRVFTASSSDIFIGLEAGGGAALSTSFSNNIAIGFNSFVNGTGDYNTMIGYEAGYGNSGSGLSAFGPEAGKDNSGDRVIALGAGAASENSADDVIAIGFEAGKDNTTANQFIVKQANINAAPLIQGDFNTGNIGIGTTTPTERLTVAGNINLTTGSAYKYNGADVIIASTTLNNYFFGGAGNLTMTGTDNTANGFQALLSNTTGTSNTANGVNALSINTTGTSNTANGLNALRINTTGTSNTANGVNALRLNTTGNGNTANGRSALFSNTTGSDNTANGFQAGYDINTAAGTGANTVIGYNTGRGIVTGVNNTILGANVTGLSSTLSNNIIIADGAGNQRINVDGGGNVGIGTTSPSSKLDVWGDFRVGTSSIPVLQTNVAARQLLINTNTAQGDTLTVGDVVPQNWYGGAGGLETTETLFTKRFIKGGDGDNEAVNFRVYTDIDTVGNDDDQIFSMMNHLHSNTGDNLDELFGFGNQVEYQGSGDVENIESLRNFINYSPSNANSVLNTGTAQLNGFLIDNGIVGTAFGQQNSVSLSGGEAGSLVGSYNTVSVVDSFATTSYGTLSSVLNSVATVTDMFGLYADAFVVGGTTTNAFGVRTGVGQSGGVIENAYGLFVFDSTATGPNVFGVYQEGVDDVNYFGGNVGIGTTTPSSKLAVAGDLRVTGAFRDTSGDAGTAGQVLLSTAAGTNWVSTSTLGIGGDIDATESNNYFFAGSNPSGVGSSDDFNIGIGLNTFDTLSNSGGDNNLAIGVGALAGLDFADNNVAVGNGSLSGANSEGNTALGYNSGQSVFSGGLNTLIGTGVDVANSSASNAVAVGNSLSAGTQSIVIGNNADAHGDQTGELNIGNLIFGTGLDGTGSTLASGNVGIGTTSPASKLTIAQSADDSGLRIYGFDDQDDAFGGLSIASNGRFELSASGDGAISSGSETVALWDSASLRMLDTKEITFGNSNDFNIGYNPVDDSFRISDGDASSIDSNARLFINAGGDIGIGTTTPNAQLTLQNDTLSGNGISGLSQYLTTTNSVAAAVQFGNRLELNADNTATTTIVGNLMRVTDNTTFGNTVRGLEVQTNRGSNTQGENTALSGFARTFGVRGVTSGDAGGSFEPAGGFFETEGTTQGNALRGYSGSITSASLLSLFQDSSAFTGTGLQMNFGNTTGSFSSSTSKYLDFQNAGSSVFTVSAFGTTTIGDGTTNNMAGLQIGFGGLCVDNDGTCNASTTGQISAVSYLTANSDLAENYFSSQRLETGEVVTMNGGLSVARAEKGAALPVLGVVSTKPGLTLGSDDTSLRAGETAYPIALSGRVPVKLSTENGPIKKGDQLMLSTLPGIAMKATGTGATIGIALEDFTETRMYSDTYLNQFGDDMVDPIYERVVSNTDPRINDGCYFGGGNATGEGTCVPLIATTTTGQINEVNNRLARESVAQQVQALKRVNAQTRTVAGKSVKVGQVVMFVQAGHRWVDETQLASLGSLFATSTLTESGENENETMFDRLVTLANSFVDGVFSIFELRADRVEVAEELCVDGVCIDADDLRQMLEGNQANQNTNSTGGDPNGSDPAPAPAPETEPEPEPTTASEPDPEVVPEPESTEEPTPEPVVEELLVATSTPTSTPPVAEEPAPEIEEPSEEVIPEPTPEPEPVVVEPEPVVTPAIP